MLLWVLLQRETRAITQLVTLIEPSCAWQALDVRTAMFFHCNRYPCLPGQAIDIGGGCDYGKFLYFPFNVVVSLRQLSKHKAVKESTGALCPLPAQAVGVSTLSTT